MKRLATLFLCLAMLCSMLPMSAAMADEEWLTLRVECFERSIPGFNLQDNLQLRYIQKNFGDPNHIKVEFVPVSLWEEETLLNTLLAGGTAPDICVTYGVEMVQQYVDMGGVLELDDLLAEYGQNLSAFLGEAVLEYGIMDVGDGPKRYYLHARLMDKNARCYAIRQDWLDKLGMKEPTNQEELYQFLVAAKENNLGGKITIPWQTNLYTPDPLYGCGIALDCFLDYDQITEEDWFAYAGFRELMPGAKEYFRWFNKLYNEGLIPETFGLSNDDLEKQYLVMGYTGFQQMGRYDSPWSAQDGFQVELEKNVEGGEWTICNPFKNMYGDTMQAKTGCTGLAFFIPNWVSEETAIAAMKYLDFLATPEHMYYLQNGEMGVNYTKVDENGIPLDLKATADVPNEYKMHAGDVVFIANGMNYGSDEINAKAAALAFPGYEDQIKKCIEYADVGAYYVPTFTGIIQSRLDYGSTVTSKEAEFLVKVTTCKPEELDATYDYWCNEILKAGGDKIIEEQRAAYQAGEVRNSYPYADRK